MRRQLSLDKICKAKVGLVHSKPRSSTVKKQNMDAYATTEMPGVEAYSRQEGREQGGPVWSRHRIFIPVFPHALSDFKES